ncbi:MAG: hypothetical protein LBI42_02360 [Chitinispirillales bacterium]|jgi:hypothetical protein|nr:hypothetical protein [Chitinispirillales bacterium]
MKQRTFSLFTAFVIILNITPAMAVSEYPQLLSKSSAAFTITNPYTHVNWNTYSQYKAALHAHTTNSDGYNTTSASAERHYELGFNIVAFADHNYTTATPDQVATGAMTPERITQMQAGQGRPGGQGGMIFIPGTNEHSSLRVSTATGPRSTHHVNTCWSNIASINQWPATSANEQVSALANRLAAEGTGFARLNHIGRNTGASFVISDTVPRTPWNEAEKISNTASIYIPYVNLFRTHPNIIGMEIINEFDNESQGDRVLWDNILSQTMPESRPVWGFSDDDSHSNSSVGFSYNIMLMPELSLPEVKRSKELGAFFAFSRVDRQYSIFSGAILPDDINGSSNVSRTGAVLNLPVPEIRSITVSGSVITINAGNHEFIRWYSDGKRIHTGAALDLAAYQSSIKSYVRAVVGHSNYGVLYTQPFGVQPAGQIYNMQSDSNLSLFAGTGSAGNSTHTLLGSNSGTRTVNMTTVPRTITIASRGGTSQGVDIRLPQLSAKPNHSYRFAFTGSVSTANAGAHNIFINAVTGDSGAGTNAAALQQVNVAANATFTLTHTATHEDIEAHLAAGVRRYRLGGASQQNLVITGIIISELANEPETHTVSFHAAANGTLAAAVDGFSIASGASVEHGKGVVFTAVPDEGYGVSAWKLNGVTIANQTNTYTLTVSADAAVTVEFAATTSVSPSGRLIPYVKPDIMEPAVTAQGNSTAGRFTAGQNPVSRERALRATPVQQPVRFFWEGKVVSSGTLSIFSSSGKFVRKISINDIANINQLACPGTSQRRRVVGSWDLKDNKGRSVGEGTYLARGAIRTADGERVKVSVVLGVR